MLTLSDKLTIALSVLVFLTGARLWWEGARRAMRELT